MEATAIGSEVHSSMFFKLFKALKRSFYHYVQRLVNVRDFSFLYSFAIKSQLITKVALANINSKKITKYISLICKYFVIITRVSKRS